MGFSVVRCNAVDQSSLRWWCRAALGHAVLVTGLVGVVPGLLADSPIDREQPLRRIGDGFGLPDGPAWDGRGFLVVSDVKNQTVHRYFPKKQSWHQLGDITGRYSGFFHALGNLYAADNSGGTVCCFRGGLPGNPTAVEVLPLPEKASEKPPRPNDLVVDHRGGVYVTVTNHNTVVFIGADGKSRVATSAVPSPNGVTLSPDQQTLYVANYRGKVIERLPVKKPGDLGAPERFAVMDDGDALGADGMTIDRAGNVYCAGATAVWIWDSRGSLLDKLECPSRPINATFGGSDDQSLFVTCFDGVYEQRMRVAGRASSPPLKPAASSAGPQLDPGIPAGITAHLDVPYASYGPRKVLMDVFHPTACDRGPRPAVVVVHGGGWCKGDKTKFRALAVDLARRGYVAAAIEYRLAAEAAFPAAIHDCLAAVRFLRLQASVYSIDPDRIAAVGGSAGGHLVGLMASGGTNPLLAGDGGNPSASSEIQVAVVMAGPLQIASGQVAERSLTAKDSNALVWFRGTVEEKPEAYTLADAFEQITEKTPPIHFITGDEDNPERNQSARERLQELGVMTSLTVIPNGKHGCWNRLPWFTTITDRIAEILAQQFGQAGMLEPAGNEE